MLAVSSGDFPARMRATGAKTVHFDLYLNRARRHADRAGGAGEPSSTRANRLFDYAAAQSGCAGSR